MNTFTAALVGSCIALSTAGAFAQDMKKPAPPMNKEMKAPTAKECKDHMAMANSGAGKDHNLKSLNLDKACADLMAKDGGMKPKPDPMKK